jgi:hypothetical protein
LAREAVPYPRHPHLYGAVGSCETVLDSYRIQFHNV